MVFLGWISIYSASTPDDAESLINLSTSHGKQLVFIFISTLLIPLILTIDSKFYQKFSSLIYLFSLLMLVGLFVFGKKVNGATSWYAIGSFSLQPSEFAKIGIALGVAKLLGDKLFDLTIFKNQLKAITLIAIPMLLINFQPDQGSALVLIAFFFVFFREGLPNYYILSGILYLLFSIIIIKYGYTIVLIIMTLFYILFLLYLKNKQTYYFRKNWLTITIVYAISISLSIVTYYSYNHLIPHRHKDRIDIALNIIKDNKGKGYNIEQSLITISNGGFIGKGYKNGSQTQGKFVPEQHTDFIYSAFAEEWGFIGSFIFILIFTFFIVKIIVVAESQTSKFSRVYGYSIASIFFIHFIVNIGMVIGMLPTVGIPLPFFSYGGSSLLSFTILLFIFIRLDSSKNNEW